jgi:regulator of sirC expression with transglutaminase-like and TPR domain
MYRTFNTLVSGEDTGIDVLQAALLIARLEYPNLDQADCEAQVEALAHRVRAILADDLVESPLAIIQTINTVLFEEEGFHGNTADYYDPDNSFFNKVLERRTGIPITLSLLYIEVARRVGLRIEGVALPFQFVARCELAEGQIYIDAFEGGLLLSEQECRARIQRVARRRIKIHNHWFEPVNPRFFVARMLNNLKNIYIDRKEFGRAMHICNLMIILLPTFASERRDRGVVHLQLRHYALAKQDLLAYLELVPKASDHEEIEKLIKQIQEDIAQLN